MIPTSRTPRMQTVRTNSLVKNAIGLTILGTLFLGGLSAHLYFSSKNIRSSQLDFEYSKLDPDEIIAILGGAGKDTKVEGNDAGAPSQSTAVLRYERDADLITGCAKNIYAGKENILEIFNPSIVTEMAKELEAIANDPKKERGAAYVSDAVRITCEIYKKPGLGEIYPDISELDLFYKIANTHLSAWDAMKVKEKEHFQGVLKNALTLLQQEEREALSQLTNAFLLLAMTTIALGLLVASALYFMLTAINGNFSRMQAEFDEILNKNS